MMIGLIVSGTLSEDALDTEFQKLFDEEQNLSAKLTALKIQSRISADTQNSLENIKKEIETAEFRLKDFDDVLVRKLLECVRVVDKTHIQVIFKGGCEVSAEVEKK